MVKQKFWQSVLHQLDFVSCSLYNIYFQKHTINIVIFQAVDQRSTEGQDQPDGIGGCISGGCA